MSSFQILGILAIEITDAQLLISGLATGFALVGAIAKWVIASPEREAAAYKQGIADEGTRCKEESDELRQELTKVRNALLRLAVAADLTPTQRSEIAEALGFPGIPITGIHQIEGDNKGGNLGSTN